MSRVLVTIFAVGALFAVAPANPANANEGGFSQYVDKKGNISLPVGYKQDWAHLGTWADAKKPGEDVFEEHRKNERPV